MGLTSEAAKLLTDHLSELSGVTEDTATKMVIFYSNLVAGAKVLEDNINSLIFNNKNSVEYAMAEAAINAILENNLGKILVLLLVVF